RRHAEQLLACEWVGGVGVKPIFRGAKF
ncbi:uncharacterized protein METZ01_LOCUS271351, partial [marine metagenome]